MVRFSQSLILVPAFLIAGCAANQALGLSELAKGHHIWDNPEIDHVQPSIPVHNNDIKFEDIPHLEHAFVDTTPVDRKDGIVVGEIGVDGGNKDLIVKLVREIGNGQHGRIDSLLIAHKDRLIFESYYLTGRINLTTPQASATKTYTGLALGRAIQLGYLTLADLDKPVISFLKELDPKKFVEGAEKVTLHQALTMHSGIRISEEQREEFDIYADRVRGQKLVQAIFEQSAPITAETQSAFSYGNYSSPLVMQVIEAVVPGTAEDFLKDELLGKMGISTYSWQAGLGGLPAAGWRASITSRAMVKFGNLIMNKGRWNGDQLIPEVFIAKASSRLVSTGDTSIFGGGKDTSNQGYGYFLWNADMKHGDDSYFAVSAQGGGGQFIILIDELDLVIVATGHERENAIQQLTAERILPAFTR